MPARSTSTDLPKVGISSGLSDLRALIRPKNKTAIMPVLSEELQPQPAQSKVASAEQTTFDQLIQLLSGLKPQLQQYQRTESDAKQLGQLSALAKLVNRVADHLVDSLPNSRDAQFEDGIRQATQYWLNAGELLHRNSPANSKGFLGMRKALPPEWAARLHQQLGLAPRVMQALLLALGLPLRTTESQANWHGAVLAFVQDLQTTLHWTKSDER